VSRPNDRNENRDEGKDNNRTLKSRICDRLPKFPPRPFIGCGAFCVGGQLGRLVA